MKIPLWQEESNARLPPHCNICVRVCVSECVFFPFFWTSSSLDVPAVVTPEVEPTGFLVHLPFAVHAFIFLARRIQPFLSLVHREVEFCVLTTWSFSTCWGFIFIYIFFVRKNPSYRDFNSRPNVSEGYEVTIWATGATGLIHNSLETTSRVWKRVVVLCSAYKLKLQQTIFVKCHEQTAMYVRYRQKKSKTSKLPVV